MKSNLAIIGVATIALLSGGCAAQGKPFERAEAPSNHAIIYVYRPYSYFSSALHPEVQCGGERAEIKPGGYHAFVLPAGHVTCRVEGETSDEVDIDADPRPYYVRESFALGFLSGHPQLNPIDTDEAQTEIQSCCVQQP